MIRCASLFVVALAFALLTSGASFAAEPATSTDPAPEVSTEPAPELESQTDLVCSEANPQMGESSIGIEDFLTTTSIRVCDDHEEQMYCGGCFCMIIRNTVNCFC